MGLLNWLNSSSRKNWHVVLLNVIMGIIMSIIIVPSVVYFTKVVPTKYEFTGEVVDLDTNEPIPNAQVLFDRIDVANTNESGIFYAAERFRADKLPFQVNDQIKVEVTASGYRKFNESFELINFKMQGLKFVLEKK